jgi:hypothetical protein
MQSLLERLPLTVRQNSLSRFDNAAEVTGFLLRNSVEMRNPPRDPSLVFLVTQRGLSHSLPQQDARHPIRMRPRIH